MTQYYGDTYAVALAAFTLFLQRLWKGRGNTLNREVTFSIAYSWQTPQM